MVKIFFVACLGITRITDNRHHPTDVLGGAILGTIVAIIGVRSLRTFQINISLEFSFAIWLVHSNDRSYQTLAPDQHPIKNQLQDIYFIDDT